MRLRHTLCAVTLTLCAAAASLAVPVSAAATIEDVWQAMSEAGMPEAFILDTRNQYPNSVHDDKGMEMNGVYRTYEEWVTLIHENGAMYVWSVIAEEMCVPVEALIEHYNQKSDPSHQDDPPYEPSVKPEKPFAEMTLEEKRAYVASLPEEERAAFLANLSPEERNSILKQLDPDKKQDVVQGVVDLGKQMGMTVTVDDADSFRFSVRDRNGNLVDSASFGLTVDPTGWNTTAPVLAASGMILLSLGGMLYLIRKQEETGNG